MDHLEEVRVTDRFHSHWVARGPLGVLVEWDAEIINDIPPTLLSWKSVGHSDVVSAGSVRFKPEGEHATEVRVKLQYDPPAGKLGATVAWLLAKIRSIRSPRILRRLQAAARDRRSLDERLSRDRLEPADAPGPRCVGNVRGFRLVQVNGHEPEHANAIGRTPPRLTPAATARGPARALRWRMNRELVGAHGSLARRRHAAEDGSAEHRRRSPQRHARSTHPVLSASSSSSRGDASTCDRRSPLRARSRLGPR